MSNKKESLYRLKRDYMTLDLNIKAGTVKNVNAWMFLIPELSFNIHSHGRDVTLNYRDIDLDGWPEWFEKVEEHIECPILFTKACYGDYLAIPFNNNKQALTFNNGFYTVFRPNLTPSIKCKLIPCKREDLKPGDTAFRSNRTNLNFHTAMYYCKILCDKTHVYISGGTDVRIGNSLYENWYKVERI